MPITLREFADKIQKKPYQVIEKMMGVDQFYSMNMRITKEDIEYIGREYGIHFKIIEDRTDQE